MKSRQSHRGKHVVEDHTWSQEAASRHGASGNIIVHPSACRVGIMEALVSRVA